ncbi:hypothetical protein QYF36_001720 [Acer negundo]|nr:hypothetical protein QYF36_001720 [Acer negundo]
MNYNELFPVEANKFGYKLKSSAATAAKTKTIEEALDDRGLEMVFDVEDDEMNKVSGWEVDKCVSTLQHQLMVNGVSCIRKLHEEFWLVVGEDLLSCSDSLLTEAGA